MLVFQERLTHLGPGKTESDDGFVGSHELACDPGGVQPLADPEQPVEEEQKKGRRLVIPSDVPVQVGKDRETKEANDVTSDEHL